MSTYVTRYRYWILLIGFALAATFSSCCSGEDDVLEEAEPEVVDDGSVLMPIHLSIPASGVSRTPGDPGNHETLTLPSHAYLFVVVKYNIDENNVVTKVYYKHVNLDDTKWILSTWGSDEPQTNGDAVYNYDGNITMTLPAQRSAGRVYAAVSPAPLVFTNSEPTTDGVDRVISTLTEEDIKDLPVDFATYSMLPDVYSTPADYFIGGNYYGTINDISTHVPHVTLHLYHVAARVDLIWNVREDMQSSVRVSDMQLQGLKNKECLLFRPTMNVGVGSSPLTLDVTIDPGNQWYARHCFYAIPYRPTDGDSYYPVTVALWQNGDTQTSKTTGYFTHTIQIVSNGLLGENTVFAPWLRGEVLITDELY